MSQEERNELSAQTGSGCGLLRHRDAPLRLSGGPALNRPGTSLFAIPFEDAVVVAERGRLSVLSLAELTDVIHEELT